MSRIAVIILNWNGKDDTLACLESVTSIDYPNFQVVVVDNGSTDSSVEAIRQAFPKVLVLETGANLGYAGGNNVGIRWALGQGFDGILVLNNDTVVDKDLLHAFARAQQRFPQAGVFGSKIYYHAQPNILWFAGGKWRPDILEFEHVGQDREDGPQYSKPKTFDYMTGCALYAPTEVFRSIGLFDEDYYLTFEETDWCYRARNKGFTPMYIPDARLWHKVSASFGGAVSPLMTYFMTRNRLLFVRRHMTTGTFLLLLYRMVRDLRLQLLPHPKHFLKGKWKSPKELYWAMGAYRREVIRRTQIPKEQATLMGIRDFLLRRFGDCPDNVRSLRARSPS